VARDSDRAASDLTTPQKKSPQPKTETPTLDLREYYGNVATSAQASVPLTRKNRDYQTTLSTSCHPLVEEVPPTRGHCPRAKANPENEYPKSCSIADGGR
jgi:hypothetical protein